MGQTGTQNAAMPDRLSDTYPAFATRPLGPDYVDRAQRNVGRAQRETHLRGVRVALAEVLGIEDTQVPTGLAVDNDGKETAPPKKPPTRETSPASDPVIGADPAAAYLGMRKSTLLRKAHRGEVPSIPFPIGKTGKFRHRFQIGELEKYVASLSSPVKSASSRGARVRPLIKTIE